MSGKFPAESLLRSAAVRTAALLFLVIFSVPFVTAAAGNGDGITGLWEVADGSGRIEISRCGASYCGAIFWLKEPFYPPDDKRGMAGSPLLDRENPNKGLASRRQLGLKIMEGYTFQGNNFWNNGKIYNTENGKTYASSITLLSHDRLELRGFIGIPLFGGATIWKRVR